MYTLSCLPQRGIQVKMAHKEKMKAGMNTKTTTSIGKSPERSSKVKWLEKSVRSIVKAITSTRVFTTENTTENLRVPLAIPHPGIFGIHCHTSPFGQWEENTLFPRRAHPMRRANLTKKRRMHQISMQSQMRTPLVNAITTCLSFRHVLPNVHKVRTSQQHLGQPIGP